MPFLLAAVHPHYVRYVWDFHSPASATEIGSVYTGLWLIQGIMLLPFFRELLHSAPRLGVLMTGGLVVYLRVMFIWGPVDYGSLDYFFLAERAAALSLFLPVRSGEPWTLRRIATPAVWLLGAATGMDTAELASRYLEGDIEALVLISCVLGLAAFLLKMASAMLAGGGNAAPVAEPEGEWKGKWVPLVLAAGIAAFSRLMPQEFFYLSSGTDAVLAIWKQAALVFTGALLISLLAVPRRYVPRVFVAGGIMVALSLFTGPWSPYTVGTGFGLMIGASGGWKPPPVFLLVVSVVICSFYRFYGVFHTDWLLAPAWSLLLLAAGFAGTLFEWWKNHEKTPASG